MDQENLLIHQSRIYSQNGEDGIIEFIFQRIGPTNRVCCEFGAWDGIHFSNCRNLIQQGWTALMIEGDEQRFKELVATYATNPSVICVNQYVGTGENSLGAILKAVHLHDMDFLSIDIDGLDAEIFETLDIHPRVICIEANAGHNPDLKIRLDRNIAKDNIGQPLSVMIEIAQKQGYDLVCYNGNAFFISEDLTREFSLPVLTSQQAYQNFIDNLSVPGKEWLYLVNLGVVDPYMSFHNPYLTANKLKIGTARVFWLRLKFLFTENVRRAKQILKKIFRG